MLLKINLNAPRNTVSFSGSRHSMQSEQKRHSALGVMPANLYVR